MGMRGTKRRRPRDDRDGEAVRWPQPRKPRTDGHTGGWERQGGPSPPPEPSEGVWPCDSLLTGRG